MPSHLLRFQHSRQSHFVTFGCYHKRQFLSDPRSKQTFEEGLERVRRQFGLFVYGYVVMPDHVHLLISEVEEGALHKAIKSLKQGVSRRLLSEGKHFWQKRYYDSNIRNEQQFKEKLRYIHRNPVRRGLCAHPEDWEWSSFRITLPGLRDGSELNRSGRLQNERRLLHPEEVPHPSFA